MNTLHLFAISASSILCACTSVPASEPDPKPPTTATVEVTAQWQAALGGAISEIAAASAGDEGAIAYAETEGSTDNALPQTRIKLQRLDGTGAMRGAAIELGLIPFEYASRITLASDGVRYIACWNGQDDMIGCATAPVGEGDASPALSACGRWPSLAYGSGGWALAYSTAEHLAILHLADDGSAIGDVVSFNATGARNTKVFLSATDSGFVLLMGETDGSMRVQSLDTGFSRIALPIDLKPFFWGRASIAASGTIVAVSLNKPYGARLVVLDQRTILRELEFDSGTAGKEGLNVALGLDGSSFGMLSSDREGRLRYGLIDGAESSLPSEIELHVGNHGYLSNSLAVFTLQGEQFLAATQGWPHGESVFVAQVRRW